jgi:hypothetical protein
MERPCTFLGEGLEWCFGRMVGFCVMIGSYALYSCTKYALKLE